MDMHRRSFMFSSLVAALLSAEAVSSPRVVRLADWQFSKDGGASGSVSVPHDWAIAGPFDPGAPGGTGKLPWIADGEYRATFTLDAKPEHARLEFDGVMAWPEVFVNGQKVGGWDFGYMSFVCDVTAAAKPGANEVVVKATTRPHRSRWYPGGGIYREVRLVTDAKDHVVPGTVFIRAAVADDGTAEVKADWTMSESGAQTRSFTVAKPRLWSVEDPHLYTLELAGHTFRYGIRTIEWTADDGFHLNGRRVQIQGVNLHSDLGPLGMAFDRDAAKRQLLLMRDLGVNAIRTSHNAPDPAFLDLCDEMGFLVWDECFDKWNETAGRKPEQKLEEFVVRNLQAFVRRDRNHPCVVCWSVSNEISPVGSKYGDENGQTRARNRLFVETVKALDPTRPVTAGLASPDLLKGDFVDDLDIQGWNYEHSYADARAKYPNVPFVYSESASAVSSYGFYRMPPTLGKTDFPNDVRQADGYDLTSAWCGDIPDVEFDRVDRDRYLAGEFVWTGIDYLGEPNPFTYIGEADCWPGLSVPESTKPRSSYFGIADLCCVPKDRYYLYRSRWNKADETVHIVPSHWNWRAGVRVPVFVYTSGDEAELFLNGRSLGRRAKVEEVDYSPDFAGRNPPKGEFASNGYYRVCAKYRLRWEDVPCEPGELKAVAYRGGRKIGEDAVRTAGEPVALKLSDDPFTPEGSRLAFVQVDVVDAKGVRHPLDARTVRFRVEGDAEILAVGNGDPMSFKSFTDTGSHPLYFGKAVAYVRRGASDAKLFAEADGVRPAEIAIKGGRPEISWSVMHPTELDPDYMQRVAEKAVEYGGVDSFEMCGRCGYAWGGINGILDYAPYPKTAATVDRAYMELSRKRLNKIVEIAHSVGKPIYYWHREGYLPKTIAQDIPGLMDEDGEIDLLGKPYLDYLRWKVKAAFDAVPGLDGIVLTLTEADISIIHNSNPKRYPSDKVVDTINRVFIEEHAKRGKRFIFRSFGSMAKDYEDLLAGARLTAKDCRFEIETKATAYDFDPFLPPNPFLKKEAGCTLGAECDGMGEYFGAGYLPAAQVPVIQRYVGEARERGVDRYTIRIDRVGNNLFDSAQEVNIYAYMRFIRDPQATAEDVMREWAAKRWKGCGAEMSALATLGFQAVSKTQFVDRNVIFHQNPPGPSMKYIKSCGICSVFRSEGDLHMTDNLWGMLHWAKVPGRAAIRAEKDEAVMLADAGLGMLEGLKGRLPADEYARHHRAWKILTGEARAVRAFVRALCAYFDDMERGDAGATSLKAAVARGVGEIEALMNDRSASEKGMDTTHCVATGEDLDYVYYVPLRFLTRELLREYDADFAAHAAMKARKDVLDYVIPGGIYDDCRVKRTAMHGSYQSVDGGVPVRFVGNATFPNATVTVEFADVPGARVEIALDPDGAQDYKLEESVCNGVRSVTIGKTGSRYPAVRSIAFVK